MDISLGKKRAPMTTAVWFAVLACGLATVFLLNVGMGSANISIGEILRVLFGKVDPSDKTFLIIQRIRLPRAMACMAGGSALAIAGLLLQTYFGNPIVEPYVLGISSGSVLFVGLVMLGGITFGVQRVTPFFLFVGAFIGAMVVMAVVMFAATRVKSIVTLLIVGLMAGYVCSAATSILSVFAEREQLVAFAMWGMGSFSGFIWSHVHLMYAIILPMLLLSFLLTKSLNALGMGDKYAKSMGVNVRVVRLALILISSVLTAAVTAFAGPVSFIGLAVPHICRILFRTSNSRILLPAALLGGGVMASLCDLLARNLLSPLELPLGAITAIIGAPLVVLLLAKREKL